MSWLRRGSRHQQASDEEDNYEARRRSSGAKAVLVACLPDERKKNRGLIAKGKKAAGKARDALASLAVSQQSQVFVWLTEEEKNASKDDWSDIEAENKVRAVENEKGEGVYPEILIVVSGLDRKAVLAAVKDVLGGSGKSIGIFTPDQVHTDTFVRLFPGERFEYNVAYQHHLVPHIHQYFRADQFGQAMENIRHEDIVRAYDFLNAKSLQVTGNMKEVKEFKRAYETSVGVPIAVPIPDRFTSDGQLVGFEGGGQHELSRSSVSESSRLYFIERNELDDDASFPVGGSGFFPDLILADVSEKDGGIKGNLTALVAKVAEGGIPKDKSIKITLTKSGDIAKSALINARLGAIMKSRQDNAADGDTNGEAEGASPSATTKRLSDRFRGIAYTKTKHRSFALQLTYEYEITFFDEDTYRKVKRVLTTHGMDHGENIRRSMSALATNRWRFYDVQPHAREDMLHMDVQLPPLKETQPQTWRELLCGAKLSSVYEVPTTNTVTIPITLYGPAGSGKSSLMNTWSAAANHTLYSWLMSHDSSDYMAAVEGGTRAKHEMIVYSSIPFDTTPGKVDRAQKVRKDEFLRYNDFDQARLVLRDSSPAGDTQMSADGTPYPLGMMVLVLEVAKAIRILIEIPAHLPEVESEINTVEKTKWEDLSARGKQEHDNDQSKFNAWKRDKLQELRDESTALHDEHEKHVKQWKNLVGERSKAKHSRLSRYPPVAAVLTVRSAVDVQTLEDACKEVRSVLGISNVLSAMTFAPVSMRERESLVQLYDKNKGLWREENKKWEVVARNSLAALEQVTEIIFTNECAILDGHIEQHGGPEKMRDEAVRGIKATAKCHFLRLLKIYRDNIHAFAEHGIERIEDLVQYPDSVLDVALEAMNLPVGKVHDLREAVAYYRHLEQDEHDAEGAREALAMVQTGSTI